MAQLVSDAIPSGENVTVIRELKRALAPDEYPAVSVTYAGTTFASYEAGEDERFSGLAAYHQTHRFNFDIFTAGHESTDAIARIWQRVFGIDVAYNDRKDGLLMEWQTGENIEHDGTMELDIRVTRLTARVETVL